MTQNATQVTTNSELKLQNVTFENGMLNFKTKADLDSAFSLIQRNQGDGALWLYKQFPEYSSMDKVFKSLKQEDYDQIGRTGVISDRFKNILRYDNFSNDSLRSLQKMVEVLTLSILLNKDGNVGFADKVLHIEYDNSYVVNSNYFFKTPDLNYGSVNSTEVLIFKNKHSKAQSQNIKGSVSTRDWTYPIFLESSNTPGRRFSAYIYESQYYSFNNVSVTTVYESWHGWWIWSGWQTDWCLFIGQGGQLYLRDGSQYDVYYANNNGNTPAIAYFNTPNLPITGNIIQYYSTATTQHHWLTYEWQDKWYYFH